MRLAFAALALAAALPAAAQTPDRASADPRAGGRQSARTAYGYRLTAPDEDDDPSDRRVLRRLNTRINNRLETRIERYRFVDTRSDRTGTKTRNPYAAAPSTDPADGAGVLRRRSPNGR